jgi:predicted HTH transcriptional regulator
LLDAFEGKLTSSKYAKLARCSQDTAHRDIVDLVKRGILAKDAAGGRSTSYSLAEAIGSVPAEPPGHDDQDVRRPFPKQ